MFTNEDDKSRFIEIYLQGSTFSSIASIYGISEVTVRKYVNLLGLPKRLNPITGDFKTQCVTLYEQGLTCEEIGLQLGKSSSSINKLLKPLVILRQKDFIRTKVKELESKKAEILKLYIESDRDAIASFIGVSYESVGHILRGLGLATKEVFKQRLDYRRRVPTCYNPFSEENFNEDSAYVLGYILGDGCIRSKHKNDNYWLNISSKDYDSILGISKVFKLSEDSIKKVILQRGFFHYALEIRDYHLINDLQRLGIRPNKSINGCNMLELSDRFFSHFIRGLFDSDGCVSFANVKKSPTLRVEICGHFSYMQVFFKRLEPLFRVYYSERQGARKSPLSFIEIYTQSDVKAFYDFMYKDANIYLNRKKVIFDEYYNSRGCQF